MAEQKTRLRGCLLALVLGATPALAQSNADRTADVGTGTPFRLGAVTALQKDCTLGKIGRVHIVEGPRRGALMTQSGHIKTPASYRCPNADTPILGLFYRSRPRFTGQDEVTYQTRTPDGLVETVTVHINVTSGPRQGVADESPNL